MDAQIVRFDSRYRPAIINIRTTVFVDEQGIDSKIDFDGLDEAATHVLVFFFKMKPLLQGEYLMMGILDELPF